jgi:hypothetical protein
VTLQYRIRSKYQDQLWRQRIYLCERLLSDAIDRWCLSDGEFPKQPVVAGVLYLFSPRCEPLELSSHRLCERLGKVIGTPEEEYRMTWPRREEPQGQALIASLSVIVVDAVESWCGRGVEPSSVRLAESLVEEVVAQQYVVFHHCETTRRDINHWGI